MDPGARLAQLIAVAEELFVARGYAGVTMEDIARTAGVTRPVVYEHFGTKEGAYLACVQQARSAFEDSMLRRADAAASLQGRIRAGAEAFFGMLAEDAGRWRLLFASNAVLPGEAGRELNQLRFETIEQIHQLLLLDADPGVAAVRREAAAHMLSGTGERLGHWWMEHPELSQTEVVDLFMDLVWDGVAGLDPAA